MTSKHENPVDFGEQMLSFKEDVLRLKKDYREGRVFETGDLVLDDADPDSVIETSCMKDIPDVSFFSLGPVYVTAKVPYSFLDQYCGEVRNEQFLTFHTPPFATGLEVVDDSGHVVGTWNDKIHAMDKTQIDVLTDFIESQVLCDPSGKLFGIQHQDAMIQDPVLKSKYGIKNEHLMRIRLFTPYTINGAIKPIIDMSGLVCFQITPSSSELTSRLRPALIAQREGLSG